MARLDRQMPSERWSALYERLSQHEPGAGLDRLIASHRAEVATWPATERFVAPESPWLAGLFEGRFDPRLELAGYARIGQVLTRHAGSLAHREMFGIISALAARLDPTFAPPDVVLAEQNTITSASGCGGGQETWTRGNAAHTIRFSSNATESPSLGMRSEDEWAAIGLPPGCTLSVGSGDFFDDRTLSAAGPCPAVLELGPAWSAVVRGATLDEVRRVLAQTRVPWR
ncbi:MAG: hypothetical protein GQE15_10410 [Archangiaceae bacterium]|nr:hypothetical protein [Archangiaceae bacterium]